MFKTVSSLSKIILVCSLSAVVITAIGCGSGQEATLEGVVTLDGSPVQRGRIILVPNVSGAGAFAAINSDGSYEAYTGSIDGLETGDYRIVIQSREDPIPDPKGGPPMPGKLITPKKYARSSTSELNVSIVPGSNEKDFELKSNAE
jgi:hypothetical protein